MTASRISTEKSNRLRFVICSGQSTVRKVLLPDGKIGGKHGRISLDQLKQIPSNLERPVAVFASKITKTILWS